MWSGTGDAMEVLPKVRGRDALADRRADDSREQATKVAEAFSIRFHSHDDDWGGRLRVCPIQSEAA